MQSIAVQHVLIMVVLYNLGPGCPGVLIHCNFYVVDNTIKSDSQACHEQAHYITHNETSLLLANRVETTAGSIVAVGSLLFMIAMLVLELNHLLGYINRSEYVRMIQTMGDPFFSGAPSIAYKFGNGLAIRGNP